MDGAQISIETTIVRPVREILEGLDAVHLEGDTEVADGL